MGKIKREFSVQKMNFQQMPLIILGLYLFGFVLGLIITVASGEGEFVPLGFIMAFIGAIISSFVIGAQFHMGFKLAVGMGVTRKNYLISFYFVDYVLALECFAAAAAAIALDWGAWAFFFSGTTSIFSNLLSFPLLLAVPVLLAAALAFLVVGVFCAALIYKWGKKAFWILWVIWMLAFVGVPQLFSRWGNTALAKMVSGAFSGLLSLSVWAYAALGIAGVAGMVLCTVLVMRKEPVRN